MRSSLARSMLHRPAGNLPRREGLLDRRAGRGGESRIACASSAVADAESWPGTVPSAPRRARRQPSANHDALRAESAKGKAMLFAPAPLAWPCPRWDSARRVGASRLSKASTQAQGPMSPVLRRAVCGGNGFGIRTGPIASFGVSRSHEGRYANRQQNPVRTQRSEHRQAVPTCTINHAPTDTGWVGAFELAGGCEWGGSVCGGGGRPQSAKAGSRPRVADARHRRQDRRASPAQVRRSATRRG